MNPIGVLRELDFERLAGSEGEARARKVILSHLDRLGLAHETEEFDIFSFDTGEAFLAVEGKRFNLHPYGLEESKVIEGELCFLENADAVTYNLGAYRDKVVMSFTSTQRIVDVLEGSGVAAYIGISQPHKDLTSLSHRQSVYAEKTAVPSLTVSYSDAEKLLRSAGKAVRIEIDQKVTKRKAHNIVATVGKPVRDRTLTYLVGHYDTVARSHGSIDNAGGTACLLQAAADFAKSPPERELKIIFFSGEELGLRGSFAYVDSHADEITERARLVVNVDLSGDVIGQDQFYILGSKELMGYAGGIAREEGLMFRQSLSIYSSDCVPFSVHEIPSVNIARVGGKGTYFVHTADDQAKHAASAGLRNSSRAARTILRRVLGAQIYPVRREIDDSLRDKLEKYLWNTLREKPDLKWREKYRR